VLKADKLRLGKIFTVVVILTQWNYISYMSPMREWWTFMFFFAAFGMFFFDMKMMTATVIGVSVSTFISWALVEELFIGVSEDPKKEALVRVICVIWTMTVLLIITYFGSKFLVEELEKYANYDTLTHLLNRRSMDNYLREAYRQAHTGRSSFCLLMADIDDFKKVNDTYGHDCGDEVLKYVAQTISTGVKKNDSVFRWGGEEICILLNTDEERAVAAAERIRADIERDPVNYRNEADVFVTVTMGVAPYRDGMTIQAMMDDADAKLYWGKQHGKNRVVNVIPEEDSGSQIPIEEP
jgi:diguanylate cyclase (GGDEF)-like protein